MPTDLAAVVARLVAGGALRRSHHRGARGVVALVAAAEVSGRPLRLAIRDPKARAAVEDNFRKTIGQFLGGAAVLIGAGFAYLQFTQQQRSAHDQFLAQQKASQDQSSQQQQSAQDLLISNQVSKGFEQLGSDKLPVRLGGIYALEGVMRLL
jgi:hypothetical protein